MIFEDIVKEVVEEAENISGKKVEPLIAINQVLFVYGSLVGLKRLKIGDRYINHMGVTFAPSGAGKDLVLSILENNLEPIKGYADIVQKFFNEDVDDSMIVPTKYKTPLIGSVQGAMRVANYLSKCKFGSFNIMENEFGSNMNKQTVELLIKLWQDGSSLGSVNVNEKYPPIENLPTNALLFGTISPFERDDKKYKDLVEVLETGFARRALFFNIIIDKIELVTKKHKVDLSVLNKALENIKNIKYFYIPKEAEEHLAQYRKKLIADYNKEPTDWNYIKTSNIDKIERIASLISIINGFDYLEVESLKLAIKLSEISDKHLLSIIKPKQPYLKIYEHLKIVKSKFKTELLDELGIKLTRSQLQEQLDMLKEYAYRNNYELKTTSMMVHLMPLRDSSLDEIIVSVNTEGKKEKGIMAQNKIAKFFGEKMSIEQLIRSKVDWYSFVHYNGTRSQKNAVPEFNCIAFDIDDGLDLDDCIGMLLPYTNIIYTTKSHRKEKNGIVADRFRAIVPIRRVISLDIDKYKEFVRNVSKLLGLYNYIDYSTVELSRLWFPNPEAQIFKNKADLLDPICCIPETTKEEEVSRAIREYEANTSTDVDKRIAGISKWAISNAIVGSRNNTLFRAGMLIKDLTDTETAKTKVLEINRYLSEPLSDREIEATIFKRLNK